MKCAAGIRDSPQIPGRYIRNQSKTGYFGLHSSSCRRSHLKIDSADQFFGMNDFLTSVFAVRSLCIAFSGEGYFYGTEFRTN
jgi:hypothetical protein